MFSRHDVFPIHIELLIAWSGRQSNPLRMKLDKSQYLVVFRIITENYNPNTLCSCISGEFWATHDFKWISIFWVTPFFRNIMQFLPILHLLLRKSFLAVLLNFLLSIENLPRITIWFNGKSNCSNILSITYSIRTENKFRSNILYGSPGAAC